MVKTYAKLFDNAFLTGFPALSVLTSVDSDNDLVNKSLLLFIARRPNVEAFAASTQKLGLWSEQFIQFWNSCSVPKYGISERVPNPLLVKPFGLNVASPQKNVGTRERAAAARS